MKIAILADIHANFTALSAVVDHLSKWKPDQVIVVGDILNRGPQPLECLQLVQKNIKTQGWQAIRGNHEDYVISHAEPDAPRHGPIFEVNRASYWTYKQIGEDATQLSTLPLQLTFPGPDHRFLQFVHGSLLGTRDGIYPETSDRSLRIKIGQDSLSAGIGTLALFAVGHTHRPVIRWIDGVLIVNAGSVGLPFDHNTQLSYAQVTWYKGSWHAEIIRIGYDIDRAEKEFFETGYLQNAGPLIQLVKIELLTATSHLYNWATEYQEDAFQGKIGVDESVQRYLAKL